MRVSFWTILIGCLITFLVGTVSVVGIVSYVLSKRSAEQLSGQIIEQVSLRVAEEIESTTVHVRTCRWSLGLDHHGNL